MHSYQEFTHGKKKENARLRLCSIDNPLCDKRMIPAHKCVSYVANTAPGRHQRHMMTCRPTRTGAHYSGSMLPQFIEFVLVLSQRMPSPLYQGGRGCTQNSSGATPRLPSLYRCVRECSQQVPVCLMPLMPLAGAAKCGEIAVYGFTYKLQ